MSGCSSWLNQQCCCRRQSRGTYIYLYSPTMASSSSMFHCLICLLCGFCLAFIFILTTVIIYNMNSTSFSLMSKSSTDLDVAPIAKKRQLQDFVNTNIDPCENFYDFVCDKWSQQKERESDSHDEDEANQHKWTRMRHRIHDKLMVKLTNEPPKSDANGTMSVSHLYQLCETQPPSSLLDEVERYFALVMQEEPYRSHLTLFNQTKSLDTTSSPIVLQYNPFLTILPAIVKETNRSFHTLIRAHRRSLPSPLAILPNLSVLNQTALSHLIQFDSDYANFLHDANKTIQSYEQQYNLNSLIVKRILSYADYHLCLASSNETNGLHKLAELLNYFLRHRLSKFNTRLMDKQIRILDKITNNHTLVEHLKRIRVEFKVLEEIVPFEQQTSDDNSSCIIRTLDYLLDRRMRAVDLFDSINFYPVNQTSEYFMSDDWPFIAMLHDRLLKATPPDTLINFVFFDYYRHLIYPYYQPHIHRVTDGHLHLRNDSTGRSHELTPHNGSCPINNCFDILNCYHPSLLMQSLANQQQISLDATKITVRNLINRFRLIIEQSDHLYVKEKKLLLDQLSQIKVVIGHPTAPGVNLPNVQSSSYLDHVQLFAAMPPDQHDHLFSTEPSYDPHNHTLLLPYGFVYLSNHSIEYPLVKFILSLLSRTIQSSPFYIECLIKSFDDANSTITDTNDEHITYLLFRAQFLLEQNIIFDEYLWPFMSGNALIKRFLIDYTAHNYCHSSTAHHFFRNNTYIQDDIALVFHCPQASSIQQSKCSVI